MKWNSFFSKGMLQGLICLILAVSIVAGLCLPGMNMKTAEPEDPLDAQQIQDITVLEVSENISSLSPIVVPTGGSAQPTEPEENDPESDTSNTEEADDGEESEEEKGAGDGDKDGNQDGLQGEEGGELVPELAVVLSWTEGRNDSRSLSCSPSGTVSADILNNRLSGGMLSYEVTLGGEDASEAMIEQISYKSDYGTGELSKRGSLTMQGGTYEITVSTVVGGQRVPFRFHLNLISDVTLKMEYTLNSGTKEVICENTRTRTTADVYTDEVSDGMLAYSFSIVGLEGGADITSVTCFQSGSGNTVTIDSDGEIKLLLKNNKTGENSFRVRAEDKAGNSYNFTINIPYKPRGAQILQIDTHDLQDGQTVTTGSNMNFSVSAYRPEDTGNVYIPVNGTDTSFVVTFNGLVVDADSSNGRVHEYIVVPPDPVSGDTNTHTIHIRVEDDYGNWGEKTLTLNGRRAQEGQIIGTAYIYVDLTVLGLGRYGPLSYDVLSNEPISYVVMKAIEGRDMGEIYGSASDTLGWRVRYRGAPEPNKGFYLEGMYTGLSASALNDSAWPRLENGTIDLDAIDAYFGSNIDLATLWRCLARNGTAKGGPDPDGGFGEYDYVSTSGWMYTVNGRFPTEGMDGYSLKDGDTLILLYSLAGGWDVGGVGKAGTNTAGYCIQAVDGSLVTNHIWDNNNQCVCCGRIQSCPHENTAFINKGNGQHVEHCNDCDEDVGSPAYHTWEPADNDYENHICKICGHPDAHFWQPKQVVKEATCTERGEVIYSCVECDLEKTEYSDPGHEYGGQTLEFDKTGHFKQCKVCGEKGERIDFQFMWDEEEEDYVCICGTEGCDVLHDWYLHNWEYEDELVADLSTCTLHVLKCLDCGYFLYKPGIYDHTYENGSCIYCGSGDPNYHECSWSGKIIQNASCTDDEVTQYTCAVCGAERSEVTQHALGHSWGEWVYISYPSCTESGEQMRTCSACGAEETQYPDAYGHSYADGSCVNCGETDPDFAPSEEPGNGGEMGNSLFAWVRRRFIYGSDREERI